MAFTYNTWGTSWTGAYDTWGGSWGPGITGRREASQAERPTATNTFSVQFGGGTIYLGGPQHLASLYQNRQEMIEEYWRKAKRKRTAELHTVGRKLMTEKARKRRRAMIYRLLLED